MDEDTQYSTAGRPALVVSVAGTVAVAMLWGGSSSADPVLWGIAAVGALCGLIGVATRSYLVSLLAGGVGLAVTVGLAGALLLIAMSTGGHVTRVSDLAVVGFVWVVPGAWWLGGFAVTAVIGFLLVGPGPDEHATRRPSA